MPTSYERVYVLELKRARGSRNFYVGTTLREMHTRYAEHEQGYGSRWTHWHPVRRCVCWMRVPVGTSATIENEVTRYLMAKFGWGNVRGGDWVFVRCKSRNWLPKELRLLGPTDVLELHRRRVSHFLPESRRIIEFLDVACGLQNPKQLNADPFPEITLRSLPNHAHHVDAPHAVPEALCAQ